MLALRLFYKTKKQKFRATFMNENQVGRLKGGRGRGQTFYIPYHLLSLWGFYFLIGGSHLCVLFTKFFLTSLASSLVPFYPVSVPSLIVSISFNAKAELFNSCLTVIQVIYHSLPRISAKQASNNLALVPKVHVRVYIHVILDCSSVCSNTVYTYCTCHD